MQWAVDLLEEYLLLVVIAAAVAVVISWVELRRSGARVRPAWLLAWSAFAVGSLLVVEREGWLRLPPWFTLLDFAVLGAALALTLRRVGRRIAMRPALGGWWFYRLGFTVPALWMALLAAQLAIGFVVFGDAGLPSGPASAASGLALAAGEALFAATTGIVAGRYLGIYGEVRRRSTNPARASPRAS